MIALEGWRTMKWTGSSAPKAAEACGATVPRRFGVAVPKRFGESAFIAAAPQGSGRAASRQHATGKDF
eukprot:tig00000532_g1889.t1